MTQEGKEEILFVLAEAPIPADITGGIVDLKVGINDRTNSAEANDAPNLLSGHTSNLSSEYMTELRRQGIAIDDDNYPSPDNVPRQG